MTTEESEANSGAHKRVTSTNELESKKLRRSHLAIRLSMKLAAEADG